MTTILINAAAGPLLDVAAKVLVAAKSHAVGFARTQRRSTKHGSDLVDVRVR